MRFDPDIHHRRSIRLREYDYSASGAYFVTICTEGRECLFGDIRNGQMQLNNAGRMVETIWLKLTERFPDIVLDEYVIMPNHFHGIITLDDSNKCRGESRIRPPFEFHVTPYNNDIYVDQGEHKVREDQGEHKVREDQGEHKVRPYGTATGSVGRIVQTFKSITTNAYIQEVKQSGWPPFSGRLWQRNYYERIIRNDEELAATREYIISNPVKWDLDRENQANEP